jgi:hypothetical protein
MEDLYIQIAQEILGNPGKMISASKSTYARTFPDHIIVFNSNIFVGKTKIWYGDLDVTESMDKLKEISEATGSPVHVLLEMDGRFDKERNPSLDNFIAKIFPKGKVSIHPVLQERIDRGELSI